MNYGGYSVVSSVRPILDAAREAVEDIGEPYDGYHADLINTLTKALQLLHSEPSERAQRRATEDLIKGFAAEVSAKVGE